MFCYKNIIIEGNIGVGKTTLCKRLAKKHNAILLLESFADNPFLPQFYKEPDKYAFTVEMAFLADRYTQLKRKIQEQDLFSDFIISDYYYMKSLIFAKQTLNDTEFQLYRQFFNIIYNAMPKPDLYVYLHADVARLMQNIKSRGRKYEQHITEKYLLDIQHSYFEFFKEHRDSFPILILDITSLDFVTNEADFAHLEDAILFSKYSEPITRLFF
ncbi:deoxyadenosine/deoxycytidine kinase [Balneicella halophila]|uniref:Deoxyadenosine/deoxycytidine kinase n=1 Tax=Balneicella halophila TaxID=1537566 RepID=A0A7L4UNE3_BALHA|nr:deoxynucleoside kinase [Balneicella halophila]PVX50700.1 deoxyadenosine/deoxycytidine kinase [Balneicella halophila]